MRHPYHPYKDITTKEIYIFTLVAFLSIILIWYAFFLTKKVEGKIKFFSWERHIEIYKKTLVTKSGENLPEDVIELISERKYSGPYYDSLHDKWVYKKKVEYTYTIYEWVFQKELTSSEYNKSPYWPTYNLENDERVESRRELYTIFFDGKLKYETSNEGEWRNYEQGQDVILFINKIGKVRRIESFIGSSE